MALMESPALPRLRRHHRRGRSLSAGAGWARSTATGSGPAGAAITAAQIALVHDAVLAKCDKLDRVADGVLTDPKACAFDPKDLACKAGQSGARCLTAPQVLAFQRAYTQMNGTGRRRR